MAGNANLYLYILKYDAKLALGSRGTSRISPQAERSPESPEFATKMS